MTIEKQDYQIALAKLQQMIDPQANFRDGQWEAISTIVHQQKRAFVVQRTGWGKSLVYFMATFLLRRRGRGVTILISPLLALMRDQIRAAESLNLRAVTINSTNYDDHEMIQAELEHDEIDLLLISPERLGNAKFRRDVWPTLRDRIGLMVIDEAHCISDWGHDFRPNYRRIMDILAELPDNLPVLATTATANNRVIEDVAEIIGGHPKVIRGSLTRKSLRLHMYAEPQSAAYRAALLSELLNRLEGSGIIYCTTTRDCVLVSEFLNQEGHNTKPYYGNVENDFEGYTRPELERQLLDNEVKALVASVALGMGFDKPDIGFVIHYQHPNSIIAYYQQIGRAGRGIDKAFIILMHGLEDRQIQEYFIENAFPTAEQVQAVIEVLLEQPNMKRAEILLKVNVRPNTLDSILTHLEVERIIAQDSKANTYHVINAEHRPDYARWEKVTAQRYQELEQMIDYYTHDGCLMHYIADILQDPNPPQQCGNCRNCLNYVSPLKPAPDLLRRANTFMNGGDLIPIEPRKRWPYAFEHVGSGIKGRIPTEYQNQKGVALCRYYDDTLGKAVRSAKYNQQPFSADLVEHAANQLRPWIRDRQIGWLTHVESLRYPNLVPDFAKRLARQLNLPYYPSQINLVERPEQQALQNNQGKVNNLLDTFEIRPHLPTTPVLLVDDFVDSRWTLTVIGYQLLIAGCEAVYPFTLATKQ